MNDLNQPPCEETEEIDPVEALRESIRKARAENPRHRPLSELEGHLAFFAQLLPGAWQLDSWLPRVEQDEFQAEAEDSLDDDDDDDDETGIPGVDAYDLWADR